MTDVALPAAGTDTPRLAYRALERRATLSLVGVLVVLSALAWWSTVDRVGGMEDMVDGFAMVGMAMPFDLTTPVFLAMWTTMMVAMMFPTIAPIVLLHRMVLRRRGEGPLASVAFAGGYLLVWSAVGVLPLLGLLAFRQVSGDGQWVVRTGGGVLVLAGLYQFTRWKETCLKACRTPLTFLMSHDFGGGLRGALKVGVAHGLYCLGCCGALMAVLFVVGLMNLLWMAAIAVVFLAEKNWRHGVGLTKLVGTATTAFGVAVLLSPGLLQS